MKVGYVLAHQNAKGYVTLLINSCLRFLLLQTSMHASNQVILNYIEVEKNVHLHVTDIGSGRPIVLIHGFPLSDEMYEYQYAALAKAGFRAIGITMRGFGHSDKPGTGYDYDTYAVH